MHQALLDKAVGIIDRCKDMSLATVRDDGAPQATVVSFAHDGLELFFFCGAESQKARNMSREPRVSVSLTAPYEDWMEIRGVSMAARARELTSPAEIQEAASLIFARFPNATAIEPVEPAAVTCFRLTPYVISVLDYTLGFGHVDTVRVSDADVADTQESMAHYWLAPIG